MNDKKANELQKFDNFYYDQDLMRFDQSRTYQHTYYELGGYNNDVYKPYLMLELISMIMKDSIAQGTVSTVTLDVEVRCERNVVGLIIHMES